MMGRCTHCLMIRPPERTIGSGYCFRDVKPLVGIRERHAAKQCVVGEVAKGTDFFQRDLRRRIS